MTQHATIATQHATMEKVIDKCAIPIATIEILIVIANSAVSIYIFINRKKNGRQFFLYGCFFVFNLLSRSLLLLPKFSKMVGKTTNQRITIFHALELCIVISSTCAFNLAIAYYRLCMVTQPFKYFDPLSTRKLSRKLLLAVIIVCLAFTIIIVVPLAMKMIPSVVEWAITLAILSTYVSLCVIYFKLVKEYKDRNNNMNHVFEAGGNREIIRDRKHRERYLTSIFIGMTTSFIILNLPYMVSLLTFRGRPTPSCDSIKGKVSIFAISCIRINTLFDPIWFIISFWCKQRRQASRVLPQDNGAVMHGNPNNAIAVVQID